MTKLIALAGSLREQSYNQQLVEIAARAAEAHGAEVQIVSLADYAIPLFSEDLEAEGVPDGVSDLRHMFAQADGILLASPEYNGSISGVLKNALDWISRPSQDVDTDSAFKGKVAGLLSASPGGLGGIRGLSHTREILQNLGTIVSPLQVAVPAAYAAFDDAGELVDESVRRKVENLAEQVVSLAARLKANTSDSGLALAS